LTLVVDWKTDINPGAQHIELYREQLRDYLAATGAPEGLLGIRDHGSNRPGTAAPRNAFCRS
jgi:hypothetical protein